MVVSAGIMKTALEYYSSSIESLWKISFSLFLCTIKCTNCCVNSRIDFNKLCFVLIAMWKPLYAQQSLRSQGRPKLNICNSHWLQLAFLWGNQLLYPSNNIIPPVPFRFITDPFVVKGILVYNRHDQKLNVFRLTLFYKPSFIQKTLDHQLGYKAKELLAKELSQKSYVFWGKKPLSNLQKKKRGRDLGGRGNTSKTHTIHEWLLISNMTVLTTF